MSYLEEKQRRRLLVRLTHDLTNLNCEAVNYCVRSGELLGRMHFFKTSIQFRLIPAVMADRVNAASCVCTTKERREKSLKLRDGSQKSKHLEEVVTHLSHDNRLKKEGKLRGLFTVEG